MTRAARAAEQHLRIGRRTVRLSNPAKPLYPEAGFTKQDVLAYYLAVAPFLLPHLKNRPVTLKRYPDGVGGKFFYEKDAPAYTPSWVRTASIPRRHGGVPIRYVLINDAATLGWCASLAALEIHPFLHRVPRLDRPTAVVFDLDPGDGADLLTCIDVAFMLKDLFDRLGLESCSKVSGSKGLQVYVPLNTRTTYRETQAFAHQVAQRLAGSHPRRVVADMAKAQRVGKVLIDWSQNDDFKTTISVYSLRGAHAHPRVSVPVTWPELRRAAAAGRVDTLTFDPAATLARVKKVGDLFAPLLRVKQALPKVTTPARAARR